MLCESIDLVLGKKKKSWSTRINLLQKLLPLVNIIFFFKQRLHSDSGRSFQVYIVFVDGK